MGAANSIPVSDDLYREISRRAKQTGVSAEDRVASVLVTRVRMERQTEEFFRRRAAGASSRSLGELLDKASDPPPDAGDEFER
jgi:hypothetical protein